MQQLLEVRRDLVAHIQDHSRNFDDPSQKRTRVRKAMLVAAINTMDTGKPSSPIVRTLYRARPPWQTFLVNGYPARVTGVQADTHEYYVTTLTPMTRQEARKWRRKHPDSSVTVQYKLVLQTVPWHEVKFARASPPPPADVLPRSHSNNVESKEEEEQADEDPVDDDEEERNWGWCDEDRARINACDSPGAFLDPCGFIYSGIAAVETACTQLTMRGRVHE